MSLINEASKLRADLDHERDAYNDLRASFDILLHKDQERLDSLLSQQEKIVSSRLGLVEVVKKEGQTPKPIQARRNPAAVMAQYEADDRKKYWEARVKERDGSGVVNDPSLTKDGTNKTE